MDRRVRGRLRLALIAAVAVFSGRMALAAPDQRPNILWLSCEDISPNLGCYGDPHAVTPELDRLASQGVRFSNAFVTAGVCAPCRATIISGVYQTTLGTHHMRCQATYPDAIRLFPAYVRQAGYYCTNNSKTDYQITRMPKDAWDESSGKAHWRNRPSSDQPFFAVFNYTGCHESGIADTAKYQRVTKDLPPSHRHDPDQLVLPPYYPDTPIVREDWKRYYDVVSAMDQWAGGLLKELEEDGLADNTIVFFWSDHGVGLPRAKRWLYDSGMHIPLIVRIPERFRCGPQGRPGTVDDELVSTIDFAPTVLNLAGLEIPG
ncbi:MAG: sulfatase, partial [Planctomycetes bacterium]|nr:sulfatase [Planctomycetota bacterium]